MSRKIEFATGEFYHVYNRGVDKRKVFLSRTDYKRFLTLLFACNNIGSVDLREQGVALVDAIASGRDDTLVTICTYCLMPNHFHLLIKEKQEKGISKFMQKLQTAYTMYFNERNHRSGSLFQGTFKATHANTDNYLKYLISYIHLNPIKLLEPKWKETGISNRTAAESFLQSYSYSSYPDCIGKNRTERIIVNQKELPKYFESIKDFKSAVKEWLEFNLPFPKV